MFTLQFAQTTKARNSTFIPPLSGATTQVLLREDTSIVKPVFRMRLEYEGMADSASLFKYNYCYCAEFNRYYFITDIISVTAVVFDIACECDVLATFREDILNTEAFVMYAESNYNTMIADNRLPISDSCTDTFYTFPFAEYSASGCFSISVASSQANGNNGMANVYVMTSNEMAQLANKLADRSFIEEVKESFSTPLDMVLSAIWMPLSIPSAGTQEIMLGDFPTGVSATSLHVSARNGTISLPIEVPYKARTPDGGETYADYRNVEPYTQYVIELPGVGIVEIPMVTMLQTGATKPTLFISYDIDYSTAEIVYRLEILGKVHPFKIVKGNLGTPVPVFNSNYNVSGAITSMFGVGASIGTTVVGVMTGNPIMAIGGITGAMGNTVSATLKMNQSEYTVASSLGGKAGARSAKDFRLCIRPYTVSDSPTATANTIGRPLFRSMKLSIFNGLVKCTGAYVKTWATEQEHQMIAQYVNSSTNFIFGGLIVE